jgi:hypothetical protein
VLVSVKATFNGTFPEVGDAENAATSFDVDGLETSIYPVFTSESLPPGPVTVRLTV